MQVLEVHFTKFLQCKSKLFKMKVPGVDPDQSPYMEYLGLRN